MTAKEYGQGANQMHSSCEKMKMTRPPAERLDTRAHLCNGLALWCQRARRVAWSVSWGQWPLRGVPQGRTAYSCASVQSRTGPGLGFSGREQWKGWHCRDQALQHSRGLDGESRSLSVRCVMSYLWMSSDSDCSCTSCPTRPNDVPVASQAGA